MLSLSSAMAVRRRDALRFKAIAHEALRCIPIRLCRKSESLAAHPHDLRGWSWHALRERVRIDASVEP